MKKKIFLLFALAGLISFSNADKAFTNFSRKENIVNNNCDNEEYSIGDIGENRKMNGPISIFGLENYTYENRLSNNTDYNTSYAAANETNDNGQIGHYGSYYDEDEHADMNNNSFVRANVVSPYFLDDMFAYCSGGYSRVIRGKLLKWYNPEIVKDEDYYCFILYGDANVTINPTRLNKNVAFQIYKMEIEQCTDNNGKIFYEQKEVNLTHLYTQNPCVYEQDVAIPTYFWNGKIHTSFKAGVYFIKALYKYYEQDDTSVDYFPYMISLNVDYKNSADDGEISISKFRFCQDAVALVWVSDFNPFGLSYSEMFSNVFESNNLSISKRFVARKSDSSGRMDSIGARSIKQSFSQITGSYKDREITLASVYVYGDIRSEINEYFRKIKLAFDKIEYIKEQGVEKLKKEIKVLEEIIGILEGASIACTIMNKIFPLPIIEGLGLVIDGLKDVLEDANNEKKDEVIKLQEEIIDILRFKSGLSEVIRDLSIQSNFDYDSVYRIDLTYTIDYDPKKEVATLKPRISSPEGDHIIKDTIPYQQEKSYCTGEVFRAKEASEIRYILDNKNEVSTFYECNTGGDDEITLRHGAPNSLAEGEYHWCHFVAPKKGMYNFYSTTSPNSIDTLDLYGELFSEIVNGRSTVGRLDFDDNRGGNKDFSIIRELEAGEKVYIRVRGANWKTYGLSYDINVKKIEGYFVDFASNDTYYEDFNRTEKEGEEMTYVFRFKESGNKIFQTFSNEDTYMELYDQDEYCLWDDEDYGYNDNSLINYYVAKDQFYTLKVYCWGRIHSEYKVTVTSVGDNGSGYVSFSDIKQENVYGVLDSTYNVFENNATIIKIHVAETGKYLISGKANSSSLNFDFYFSRSNGSYSSDKLCINENEFSDEEYLDADNDYYIVTSGHSNGSIELNIALQKNAFTLDDCFDYEKICDIANNDYACYWYSFSYSGYKLFSLFGNENASLELYDSKGILLGSAKYNDSTNTYPNFCYKVTRLEKYIVKINGRGTSKLSITSVREPTSLNSIKKVECPINGCQNILENYESRWLRVFEPTTTGYYTFETNLGINARASMTVFDMSSNEATERSHSIYGASNGKASFCLKFESGKKYILYVEGLGSIMQNPSVIINYVGKAPSTNGSYVFGTNTLPFYSTHEEIWKSFSVDCSGLYTFSTILTNSDIYTELIITDLDGNPIACNKTYKNNHVTATVGLQIGQKYKVCVYNTNPYVESGNIKLDITEFFTKGGYSKFPRSDKFPLVF